MAGARFIGLEQSSRDDLGFGEWRCTVGGGPGRFTQRTGHSAYFAVIHAAIEVQKWGAVESTQTPPDEEPMYFCSWDQASPVIEGERRHRDPIRMQRCQQCPCHKATT